MAPIAFTQNTRQETGQLTRYPMSCEHAAAPQPRQQQGAVKKSGRGLGRVEWICMIRQMDHHPAFEQYTNAPHDVLDQRGFGAHMVVLLLQIFGPWGSHQRSSALPAKCKYHLAKPRQAPDWLSASMCMPHAVMGLYSMHAASVHGKFRWIGTVNIDVRMRSTRGGRMRQ